LADISNDIGNFAVIVESNSYHDFSYRLGFEEETYLETGHTAVHINRTSSEERRRYDDGT